MTISILLLHHFTDYGQTTRAKEIIFNTVTQAFNQHHFIDGLPTLTPLATALSHTIAHSEIYLLDAGY